MASATILLGLAVLALLGLLYWFVVYEAFREPEGETLARLVVEFASS
jgi:hypothetical protein